MSYHRLNCKANPMGLTILALIVAATTCIRFLPFSTILPFNFSPLTAIALFSGFYFLTRWYAFLIPLVCIWVSDMFVNYLYTQQLQPFYEGCYWQYGTYVLIILLGSIGNRPSKITTVVASSLAASVIFYLITNFGTWVTYDMYPKNIGGLSMCYVAGIPFFKISLIGDLFFTGLLYAVGHAIHKNAMLTPVKL